MYGGTNSYTYLSQEYAIAYTSDLEYTVSPLQPWHIHSSRLASLLVDSISYAEALLDCLHWVLSMSNMVSSLYGWALIPKKLRH